MLTRKLQDIALAPDDVLTGSCATCHTAVTLARWQSTTPKKNAGTTTGWEFWADLPYGECPQCGARVYLMPRKS